MEIGSFFKAPLSLQTTNPSLFLPYVTLTLRKEGNACIIYDVAFNTKPKRKIASPQLHLLQISHQRVFLRVPLKDLH